MQKQIQLAFTSHHESKVKTTLDIIRKNSQKFDIVIPGSPIKEEGPLDFQPVLRGCNKEDLKVYSLSIIGTFANARNLVKMETPQGVQIDLLF